MQFRQHFSQVKQSCSNRIRILRILGYKLKRGHRKTLLQVGNSLITSKLTYGIGLTSCNLDLMDEMLSPIYNEVVRMSSGAFRSSPVESLLAESGCLPFRLLLTQRLAQLGIRIVEKGIERCSSIIERSRNIYQTTINESIPNICPVTRLTDRLWYIKPPKTDNTLRKSIKAGSSRALVIPKFQEFITNKYSGHKQFYTDGSKSTNECGAGVYTRPRKISRALPKECSIFSAEAYALNIAVQEADPNEPTLILTDSASCLDALSKGTSRHPWIQSLETQRTNHNITFTWVPGHAGIVGNEEADTCANVARNSLAPPADFRIPAQDAVRSIKTGTWRAWEHRWHSSQSFLRQSKYTPNNYVDQKCPSDQRVLTRLRIGHTRLTHSYLFDKSSAPMCQFCGVLTTVQHILTDCRGFKEAREEHNIKGTVFEILKNEDSQEKSLLQFLKKCKIYETL